MCEPRAWRQKFLVQKLFANKKNEWTFFFLVDIFFFEFTFFFEIFEVCVRQIFFFASAKKQKRTFFLLTFFFEIFDVCVSRGLGARNIFCLCEKKMS